MRLEDQKRIVVEVVERVLSHQKQDPASIEQILFDTLYEERRRLETEKDKKKAKGELAFYKSIQSKALKSGTEGQREALEAVILHFAQEVLGHFNETLFRLATQVVPVALNLLLNTLSPIKIIRDFPHGVGKLDDHVLIEGETQALQHLAEKGTIVVVPTHCSNLDSILIGYVIHRLGLPPFLYGAGLNLFSHNVIGFFMHRLGAYKVDRRKKAPLYKDVLKTYAGYSMELGYHNVFFPGGTRSRSGSVEKKLKLGLLGMGLDAYIHNLIQKKEKPDIFIVPCTFNYQFVLEAETLIEDYLKEVGKSRYIIEDDEFTQIKRILDFVSGLFSLDSRIHVVFSKPLDVFGNPVDPEGNSLDHRGRPVDRRKYVMDQARPVFHKQRDQEYTQELSQAIVDAYQRDTVIGSVQLVSRAVFQWLKEANPDFDLYRLLRTGGTQSSLPLPEAYRRILRTLDLLKKREAAGKIRLDDSLKTLDPVALLSEALAHLNSYHIQPVLERRGDRLFPEDRNLLFFYQNRVPGLEAGA